MTRSTIVESGVRESVAQLGIGLGVTTANHLGPNKKRIEPLIEWRRTRSAQSRRNLFATPLARNEPSVCFQAARVERFIGCHFRCGVAAEVLAPHPG